MLRLIASWLLVAALAGCGYPYPPPALAPAVTATTTTGTPPPPVPVPPPPRGGSFAVTAPVAGATTGTAPAPVILVSIDGFRPDYLRRGDTPNLDALADSGVFATMRPSFPSLTFPNHYALVTGLRPDRNGIVSNTMRDPAKPGVLFEISNAKVSHDPFWWDQAEPLWVTAERAGLRTATMFWPGSDAAILGVRPNAWVPYDAAVDDPRRVAMVLDWLRRPVAERPRFVTLYFDVVDKASHHEGFDSPEKTAAIRDVDAAIGQLRGGLAAQGLSANLVIVSDHGMAPVPAANRLPTSLVVDAATMQPIVEGPLLYISARDGVPLTVLDRAVGRHDHYQCWRREALPARFHYGRNARVAPLVCLADLGWLFSDKGPDSYVRGDHGFDPYDPAMRALFIANGPAFVGGKRLATFDNVDVAPLLRDLLRLPPGQGLDGTDAPFAKVLR